MISTRVLDTGYRLSLRQWRVRDDGYLVGGEVSFAVEYYYGWAVRLGERRWARVRRKKTAARMLLDLGEQAVT